MIPSIGEDMQTLLLNVKPRVLKSVIKSIEWANNPPALMKAALEDADRFHELVEEAVTSKIRSMCPELVRIEANDDEYLEYYSVRGNTLVLTITDTDLGENSREIVLSP